MTQRTPIGMLTFSAETATQGAAVVVRSGAFKPILPPGMSVQHCIAVIFSLNASTIAPNLSLQVKLDSSEPIKSGAQTGEGLEAQSWSSGSHIVLVGTEDHEYLRSRIKASEPTAEFLYAPDSFSLALVNLPPNATTKVHFIAAWNRLPEAVECSSWYAVEQPHLNVVAQIAA